MTTTCFFRLLFGDDAPGHLVLWTCQRKKTLWIPANHLEAAGQLAERLATTCDVYFGVALQDRDAAFARWRVENPGKLGEPTSRGYSETAKVLPGLWADIDILHPAHSETALPPTLEAALALVREFPVEPTLTVFSGHGVQPWWLFRELWVFDSEAERQQAQALARRFLATLQVKAQARGWRLDPVADLARVLRVPGTFNRKLPPALPVKVIEANEVRYNPSDFEPYLAEAGPVSETSTSRQQWRGPAGTVVSVLKLCKFIQHCQQQARTLSEPFWWSMISTLARLAGGKEAIHALSAPYPRYTASETEKKIASALAGPGPHTCRYIQKVLGFTGCPADGCGVRAPAALGVSARAVQVAEARQRFADVHEQARRALAWLHGRERSGEDGNEHA